MAILIACLTLAAAAFAAASLLLRRRWPAVVAVAALAAGCAALALCNALVARGADWDRALSEAPAQAVVRLFDTEEAYTEAEVPEGAAVVLYRYGCADCEASHAALTEWADSVPFPVIWVDSESDLGQELAAQGRVAEVPWVLWKGADGTLKGADGTQVAALPREALD